MLNCTTRFEGSLSMGWKKKIEKWISDIASGVMVDIIVTALIGFAAPATMIWSAIKNIMLKSEGKEIPLVYWIVLGCSFLVSVICIILVICYIIKRRNRPNFPKIISDVRYELAKSELFFKSREEILCSREVKFEVVCEKMDSIRKQFTWTGTEYKGTILEKSQGSYTINDYQRKKPPHGYEVKFDSMKTRGEKIWYRTKTEVGDTNHEMKPFLSHTVKSPTDKLEIRVTAPIGLIKNVRFSVYADNLGEIPISDPKQIMAKDIGNLETYSYEVNKPYLLYNYRLDWEFV